ncbi:MULTISPECIES: ATP-grasp domain-containing protein [unclassified Micromonospora]|uniref:ATP-grasp domain-containing protein n=1 Tax=unclassified Micromonospora TaxID=2617518 RepID=UPI002FF34EE6
MRLIDLSGATVDVHEDGLGGRGWARRLAPAGWDHGVTLGSHAAAILSSRLALLAAILRDPNLTWLTSVDALFAAENKLVQYRAALAAALRVPPTLVSGSANDLRDELGDRFVLKPLGPSHFQDEEGRQKVVYVREVRAADLAGADLLDAPFLAQKIVSASLHLRVVTVRDRAWVAELDAVGVPLDWREHRRAHRDFTASNRWPEVEQAAVRLAAALHVGYSSQDWVVDADGPVFLDLNPGGQWLFLPEPVATSVAQAIADYLAEN